MDFGKGPPPDCVVSDDIVNNISIFILFLGPFDDTLSLVYVNKYK
jgi:hypothetical protein